ncbi:MAG: hypothetical protein L0Y54_13680 [Sporichthyaceae bacterium]|nr:hypothetical protein [Sporichthyaceae bacterium]
MPRRVSLPGADELFRTTGASVAPVRAPRQIGGVPAGLTPLPTVRVEPGEPMSVGTVPIGPGGAAERLHAVPNPDQLDEAAARARPTAAPRAPKPPPRPTGRTRHDEKITVYVSSDELLELEHARLVLRGKHGIAVDRGRIVREAIAILLADLDHKGDTSVLVRRLRNP